MRWQFLSAPTSARYARVTFLQPKVESEFDVMFPQSNLRRQSDDGKYAYGIRTILALRRTRDTRPIPLRPIAYPNGFGTGYLQVWVHKGHTNTDACSCPACPIVCPADFGMYRTTMIRTHHGISAQEAQQCLQTVQLQTGACSPSAYIAQEQL
jgi:hypothetical protein